MTLQAGRLFYSQVRCRVDVATWITLVAGIHFAAPKLQVASSAITGIGSGTSWPRNFVIALIAETIAIQPIARYAMVRLHGAQEKKLRAGQSV